MENCSEHCHAEHTELTEHSNTFQHSHCHTEHCNTEHSNTEYSHIDVYNSARDGDIESLMYALNQIDNLNWYFDRDSEKQNCAIHVACSNNHVKCVQLLLEYSGLLIEVRNKYKQTPLFISAAFSSIDCLEFLLSQNANIESKDFQGLTPLFISCYKGHHQSIRLLLESGANIESMDNQGRETPLLAAVQGGYLECCRLLLDKGAVIDDETTNNTALMKAAALGHTEIVALLLSRGADTEKKNTSGDTAIIQASWLGHTTIVDMLLDQGAFIDAQNDKGFSACYISAYEGHLETVKLLCTRDINIELQNSAEMTAVYAAATSKNFDCMRYLLDRNASITELGILRLANVMSEEAIRIFSQEFKDRSRRSNFDNFIAYHIDYPSYIEKIFTFCYPLGSMAATPHVGWDRADQFLNKYYFEEILFYVHMHVAQVCTRSVQKISSSTVVSTKNSIEAFANNDNKTFTLMKVLADKLTEFLKPNMDFCYACNRIGNDLECPSCGSSYYCSIECAAAHRI